MSFYVRVRRKARRELLARTARFRGTVKAAVVGCGQIAPAHLSGYTESGLATVVAISDVRGGAMGPHLDRYPHVRGLRDYRQMLAVSRPDVVSVCTWPQDHLGMVRTAAEHAVKGVLCEKPMALQMRDVTEMQAICRQAGIKLGIGHQYRFHPYFTQAAAMIRSGELGRLVALRGHCEESVANTGPHLLDSIRFLLGDRPLRRVSATFEGFGAKTNRGWAAEDGARGQLTFDDGLVAHVNHGTLAEHFFAIEVEGDEASLRITM